MNPRILIVGGGPAGTACAITTARAGLETILFEKGGEDRDKICGDALVKDAQKLLENLGVLDEVKYLSTTVNDSNFIFPNEKSFGLEIPMLILQRRVLDRILRDEVENSGGRVVYQGEIKGVHIKEDGVSLRDNYNNYRGDVLVLATGSNISLSKTLGFISEKSTISAIRGYASNKKNLRENFVYLKPPIGYGWIFPCPDNLLNVGFHVSNNKDSLRKLFDKFVAEVEIGLTGDLVFLDKPRGGPIRSGLGGQFYSDKVILVGENMGTTYELTGEGISRALESGIIAGQAIVESEPPYNAKQLKKYEEMIKKTMKDIHGSYRIARYLFENKFTNKFFESIFVHSPVARRFLSEFFNGENSSDRVFSIPSQVEYWTSFLKKM